MPANLPVFPAPGGGLPVLLAQGAAGLVAPGGLEQAAKPVNPVANVPGAKMAQNFANAPAGGAPAAPAATGTTAAPAAASGLQQQLMKYGPSYVLMALLIGLGVFIICRPYSLPEDKMD
jgi:hypothetical protein